MPEAELDHIRLSLPADADLRKVVEVAVAVVARRMDLPDTEVTAARTAAGDAFAELVTVDGASPVELDITLEARRMVTRIRAGGVERRVTAPTPADGSG